MEQSPNPYSSPSANLFGSRSQTTSEGVPAEAVSQLQRTKPWVRFMSVMMWIGLAFMLLGAVAMAALSMIGGEVAKASGLNPPMMIGLAVTYTLFSFLYIYPAVKLWQYASTIQRLTKSHSTEDLVAALSHQRVFWKFVAILAIVIISLYLLFIVAALALGITTVLNASPSMRS